MKYKGPNFNDKLDPRFKELKKWCQIFHEKGLAPPYPGGSYGNLSFRLIKGENPFIITASRCSLENYNDNSSFVLVTSVDLNKKEVYEIPPTNERIASSEAMLHNEIYQKRKDINAIFHGHCDRITNNAKELGIIETRRKEPYGTVRLVNQVLKVLRDKNFVQMKGHGFISLGRTINEAGENILERYEKSLKTSKD